ncbi:MAG: hypothetical protein JNG86_00710, partial [Verrucomicrobiaceae bacterium]|nr:hypothetical protein [Verrucomicrobiaceae bacterium]
LDDATFEKVSSLHSDYFRQCDKMCRQIDAADRPLLWRARGRGRQHADLEAQLAKEQVICTDCENAAIAHLQQVAALMPAPQGQRFLDDILPVMRQQRLDHDAKLSSSLRR